MDLRRVPKSAGESVGAGAGGIAGVDAGGEAAWTLTTSGGLGMLVVAGLLEVLEAAEVVAAPPAGAMALARMLRTNNPE